MKHYFTSGLICMVLVAPSIAIAEEPPVVSDEVVAEMVENSFHQKREELQQAMQVLREQMRNAETQEERQSLIQQRMELMQKHYQEMQELAQPSEQEWKEMMEQRQQRMEAMRNQPRQAGGYGYGYGKDGDFMPPPPAYYAPPPQYRGGPDSYYYPPNPPAFQHYGYHSDYSAPESTPPRRAMRKNDMMEHRQKMEQQLQNIEADVKEILNLLKAK